MSDDRPNPFTDVRKGLGLLFRAARTTISRLPKGGLEEVMKESAREVGRSFENVAKTVERGFEREILGRRDRASDKGTAEGEKSPGPKDPPSGPRDAG